VLHRGPAYPADLAEQLGVSRSNLSNHLALLRACTLVDSVTQGRRSLYRIADTHAAFALRALLDTANPEVPAAGGGAA
jgi:DNA-binding transcriptional ArsR family regulator